MFASLFVLASNWTAFVSSIPFLIISKFCFNVSTAIAGELACFAISTEFLETLLAFLINNSFVASSTEFKVLDITLCLFKFTAITIAFLKTGRVVIKDPKNGC